MKHRHLFGAAALLLCGLCVGLAGCGGAGTKVDAETWSAAFDNLDNYTISVEGAISIKVADDMVQLYNPGTSIIASAKNDEYYLSYREGEWEKRNDDDVLYQSITTGYNLMLSLLKDSYEEFTFKDGQYQCETLTLNTEAGGRDVSITMNHIAVTFDNKVLKEITFGMDPVEGNPNPSVAADATAKISEFGTTTIELPAEYTDKTTKG